MSRLANFPMWIRLLLITFIAFTATLSDAYGKVAKSCYRCHNPDKSEDNCVSCHTNSLSPREGRSANGLYRNAPFFEQGTLNRIRPFDDQGLLDFLKNPPLRRRHYGGMYSSTEEGALILAKSLKEWSKTSIYQSESDRAELGHKLFLENGCEACHGTKTGLAPILPIGYQLYNFEYVANVIRGADVYYRKKTAVRTMPTYKNLSDDEVKSIFSYISSISPQGEILADDSGMLAPSDRALNSEVYNIFKKNGCRHCHGSEGTENKETKDIFGGTPDQFILSQNKNQLVISGSKSVFARDAKGQNKLIEVLLERKSEEAARTGNLRGMPLSLPSLKDSELRTIKLWVRAGCPTVSIKLCYRPGD